ncbi:MAG TPA: cobalt ECF transporter T component CbiQ [Syntrophales bacterium]|nr:cobalt ECF transporter T component CbiQ [Syntrophales bacterium]
MRSRIPAFLLERSGRPQVTDVHDRGTPRGAYVERGIKRLSHMITVGFINGGNATGKGLFQDIDPRLKLLALVFSVLIISVKKDIFPEVVIAALTFIMVALSRLDLWHFYRKVVVLTFFFGLLVALPAVFNVVTPGEMILPVIILREPHQFWIYHIPQEIGLTRQGVDSVLMLCLRMMNSLAISFLVIHTTPFHRIMKALQLFRVPQTFVLVITLSYKYIFIFAKTVEDMYLARKSRLAGMARREEATAWVAGRITHMFRKSVARYDEVFGAMTSRGFTEEIRLAGFEDMSVKNWSFGLLFLSAGIFILMI